MNKTADKCNYDDNKNYVIKTKNFKNLSTILQQCIEAQLTSLRR